jgi:hypothetical protein
MKRLVRAVCITFGVFLIGFVVSAPWPTIVPFVAVIMIVVGALFLFFGFRKG